MKERNWKLGNDTEVDGSVMTNNHQVKVRGCLSSSSHILHQQVLYIFIWAPLRTFQSLTLYSRLQVCTSQKIKSSSLSLMPFLHSSSIVRFWLIQILESVNAVISDDEIDVMSHPKGPPCCEEKADDNLIRLNRYPYSKSSRQVSSIIQTSQKTLKFASVCQTMQQNEDMRQIPILAQKWRIFIYASRLKI